MPTVACITCGGTGTRPLRPTYARVLATLVDQWQTTVEIRERLHSAHSQANICAWLRKLEELSLAECRTSEVDSRGLQWRRAP